MSAEWYRRPRVLIAAAVFALALGVYTATLAPTISFWDCGEFITCSHIVGIPHQPGTPLYVLVGRVFDVIFGDVAIDEPAYDTARAVNLMSAFFSALAVALVYLIVLDISRRADPDAGWLGHVGGVVGALFLLFSETYWNNAIEAEVYGLAAFVIALVTWLALRWYEWRDDRASDLLLILIVYLLGLGVGFHLGSLLVYAGVYLLMFLARRDLTRADIALDLPVIALGVALFVFTNGFWFLLGCVGLAGVAWRGRINRDHLLLSVGLALFLKSTMVSSDQNAFLMATLAVYVVLVLLRFLIARQWYALAGTAVFVLGLSVHIMMLIRAGATPEPAINQTDPDNFKTLLSVLRREQYPTLNPFERQADLGWQFGYYYGFLKNQFYFLGNGEGVIARIGTFIGPIFLALLGVFHSLRRARPVAWMILLGYLINSHGLTLMLNFTTNEVRDRDYFYFAAFLFAAVFIGIGAAALLRFAAGPEGKSRAELDRAPPRTLQAAAPLRIGWLPRLAAIVLLVAPALPLLLAEGVPALGIPPHTKWFQHDRSENRIAYQYARNILAGLDENAIIFTNGDNDTFPIWYLQEVERYRRDVTVVNLSLVNLPWYVEQIRHREPPLALSLSEQEIRQLRPHLMEDPRTGERRVVYVRDYVVGDAVNTNLRSANERPMFFAVTIPRENMMTYFPYLQMEGLAYRLTRTKGPDDLPATDSRRLLNNFFGVYSFDALLTGDDEGRRRTFAALIGAQTDVPRSWIDLKHAAAMPVVYDQLMDEMGERRRDVFENQNTRFLLGNYPVALVRAGYQLRQEAVQALQADAADTLTYDAKIADALTAFELAVRISPANDLAAEAYPLLLLERRRDDDALAYLANIAGRIPLEIETRVVSNTIVALAQVGRPGLAVAWTEEQIERHPERKMYYEILFQLYRFLDRFDDAAAVADRWAEQAGDRDPAMMEALRTMRRDSGASPPAPEEISPPEAGR